MNRISLKLGLIIILIKVHITGFGQTAHESMMFTTVSCDTNIFFAISNNGIIRSFTFLNNMVSFNSVVNTPASGNSLGYCNQFITNSNSHTFFSNQGLQPVNDRPIYFDSSWISFSPNDTFFLANCGGSGGYLYYNGAGPSDIFPKYILKADSGQNNLIYTTPQGFSISVADLVADSIGNVWFFIASDTNIFATQFLCTISPTGTLLNQFPVSIYTMGAYGMFLKNNKFYIGISNSILFDKLLPFNILGSSIIFDSPIATNLVSSFGAIDLASCYNDIPTGFKEIKKPTTSEIILYPNPTRDKLTVGKLPPKAQELYIINSMGAMVWQQDLKNETEVTITTSRFAPGMYAVCVKTSKEVLVKKMVRE